MLSHVRALAAMAEAPNATYDAEEMQREKTVEKAQLETLLRSYSARRKRPLARIPRLEPSIDFFAPPPPRGEGGGGRGGGGS